MGFETVFVKTLATKITLSVVAGLFAFAFLYLNLRFAQRGLVPRLWDAHASAGSRG